MSTTGEYAALRGLPREERQTWIERRYPDGPGIQWWLSIADSAETEIIKRRWNGQSATEVYEFAASFLDLGEQVGALDPCHASYWLLRLASSAIRFGVSAADLPGSMTPDGAARRAVAALPLGQDEVIATSREFYQELDENPDGPPTPKGWLMARMDLVLSSLPWVQDAITDPDLQERVAEWLDTYAEMAPD